MEMNDYEESSKQQAYPIEEEHKIKNVAQRFHLPINFKEKYKAVWAEKGKSKYKLWIKPGILLVTGIFLMCLSGVLAGNTAKKTAWEGEENLSQNIALPENTPGYMQIEQQLEAKLERTIGQVAGVDNVLVSVTLDTGLETNYAIDSSTVRKTQQESDAGGVQKVVSEETSNQQLVLEKGGATPIITKESMPQVRGVAVVATGMENATIREQVFQIVQGLLDVPAHRIIITNGKE